MSVESLMVHEVTLLTQDGVSQGSSGEVTVTYSETATMMALQPKTSTEEMSDRNTPIGDWLGVGRADIDWESTQRILYGDHTFDIIGSPRPMPNLRLDTISHVEMDLQEIT